MYRASRIAHRASRIASLILLGALPLAHGNDHVREIERWRAERVAKLTAPDGWLSLIGLHFLKDGANTVGSAKDNDVVLAKGPARVGTVTVAPDGKVTLAVARGADVRIGGRELSKAELSWDEKTPTPVTSGTVTFFVVDRSGKKALRVRDSASERRRSFAGIDYFPIDPKWRVVGRWQPFEKARIMPVPNILGQMAPTIVPGKAVFQHEGKTYELLAIDEGVGDPLFWVISDATTGKETYGAARYFYANPEPDGSIVLDFNKAYNPPCAFTTFATCPLPPKENRLPFPIRAGEKTYRGAHE